MNGNLSRNLHNTTNSRWTLPMLFASHRAKAASARLAPEYSALLADTLGITEAPDVSGGEMAKLTMTSTAALRRQKHCEESR
jgi:hypothetical protein